MDEATASVDGEIDFFIQNMLRTRFKDTTLLTIAHRLHTVMDYDLVLVIDAGRAAEFDSPKELLEKNEWYFFGACGFYRPGRFQGTSRESSPLACSLCHIQEKGMQEFEKQTAKEATITVA